MRMSTSTIDVVCCAVEVLHQISKIPVSDKRLQMPSKLAVINLPECLHQEMAPRKKKGRTEKPPIQKPDVVKKKKRVSHPCYEEQTGGYVLSMGQGDVGQLGLGEDALEKKKPAPVLGLEGVNLVQVVCGGMHSLALSEEGLVYSWGCNDEGALGRETEGKEGSEFTAGVVKLPGAGKIVHISAGDSHSAALSYDGSVYIWGTYRDGSGPVNFNPGMKSFSVRKVYPPDAQQTDQAVKIASGNDHTVILTDAGNVYTFGNGEQGQLGRIKECFSHRGGRRGLRYLLDPQIVRFKSKKLKFLDIFTGSFHTFAVERDGDVYAWGLNNYGQLGTGNKINQFDPAVAEPLSRVMECKGGDSNCKVQIAGGQHHSIALSSKSKVFCFGRSDYGRLGLGNDAVETAEPTQVTALDNLVVKQVACGEACSFAVSQQGTLHSWGLGTCLQLGSGEEDDVTSPLLVKGKNLNPEKHEVLGVDSGGQHTTILVKDKPLDNKTS